MKYCYPPAIQSRKKFHDRFFSYFKGNALEGNYFRQVLDQREDLVTFRNVALAAESCRGKCANRNPKSRQKELSPLPFYQRLSSSLLNFHHPRSHLSLKTKCNSPACKSRFPTKWTHSSNPNKWRRKIWQQRRMQGLSPELRRASSYIFPTRLGRACVIDS